MAALEAEHFRGAADVAMIFVQLLENVVAFISGARLVQRGALAARHAAAALSPDQVGERQHADELRVLAALGSAVGDKLLE